MGGLGLIIMSNLNLSLVKLMLDWVVTITDQFDEQIFYRVTTRCRLNVGTVPTRCRLNVETVPTRCRINVGTVPTFTLSHINNVLRVSFFEYCISVKHEKA